MYKNAITPEFIIYNEVNSLWRKGWKKNLEKKRENSASVKEFWMVQVVYVKRSTYRQVRKPWHGDLFKS